jgi:hypothetical protein
MTGGSWMQETLRLRAWALDALTGRADAEVPGAATPWRIFARSERCAIPLRARLRAGGVYPSLPENARSTLETVARVELQRVLSARAHLRVIDRLAARGGWEVAVLKGGAACFDDRDALDLADLDVLARPADARALAAALDASGYGDAGPSSPQHLEGRMSRGGLKVEVHTAIDMADAGRDADVWNAVVPIEGTACLRLLAPRDHLWHLLVHVGVLHPYRRGALRDSLLIAQAVRRCGRADLEGIDTRIADHVHGDVLRDLLITARALMGTGPVPDRFTYQAAVSYFVSYHGRRVPLPELLRADVGKWAVALVSGRDDVRREWGRIRMVTTGRSLSRQIAWIEARSPWVGRLVRVTSRVVRVGIGALLGAPLAAAAAHAARRATRAQARNG